MAKWVWKGYFEADIPDDWVVRDKADLIEMLPPKPVGALQISVFKISDGELAERCVEAVNNFVAKQAGQFLQKPQVEIQNSKQLVSGEFKSGDSHNGLFWLISAIGWSSTIALVTYCYGGKRDNEVHRAVEIMHSISPV